MSVRTKILGAGLLGVLAMPVEAGDGYEAAFSRLPLVEDADVSSSVGEGFSTLFIYTSRPSTLEGQEYHDMGVEILVHAMNVLGSESGQYLRMDTQDLIQQGMSSDDVSAYLSETYGVWKRPSLVMFCNGERVYKINGAAPKDKSLLGRAKEALPGRISEHARSCR